MMPKPDWYDPELDRAEDYEEPATTKESQP